MRGSLGGAVCFGTVWYHFGTVWNLPLIYAIYAAAWLTVTYLDVRDALVRLGAR